MNITRNTHTHFWNLMNWILFVNTGHNFRVDSYAVYLADQLNAYEEEFYPFFPPSRLEKFLSWLQVQWWFLKEKVSDRALEVFYTWKFRLFMRLIKDRYLVRIIRSYNED